MTQKKLDEFIIRAGFTSFSRGQENGPADEGRRLSEQLGPKVWARKDQLQHASTRGGLLCAMYPDTNGRADLEPLYDAATVRAMVEGAWCAGYYDAGYTHDSAYAEKQSEKCADEFLGP